MTSQATTMHPAAAALLAAALAASASACGMTTHMTIGNRALSHMWSPALYPDYATLLYTHTGALLAGLPYPDYLYECGPVHDNGEYTHWAPFQAVASQYIRSAFPRPWNDSAQQLVAFMHGVVSHYIADLNWHGMGNTQIGYGLIETLGGMDFNCTGGIVSEPCGNGSRSMGDPHTLADTGGEFVASYAVDLSPWDDPNTWVVPADDLVNIYALANRTVNASDIRECAVIFYAGTVAVRYLGWLVEPLEINDSPTFTEQYVDMPCGGVDDMAIWSGHMWNRWEAWLEQGAPDVIPVNAQHGYGHARAHAHKQESLRAFKALFRVLAPMVLDSGLLDVELTNGGRSLAVTARSVQRTGAFALLKQLRTTLLSGDAALRRLRSSLDVTLRGVAPGRTHSAEQSWTAPRARDSDTETVAADLLHLLAQTGLRHLIRRIEHTSHGASNSTLLLEVLAVIEGVHDGQVDSARKPSSAEAAFLSPIAVFASAQSLEYAGSSLSVGDFDADGLDDVIITAYGHAAQVNVNGSLRLQPQSGGVYVRYGNMSLGGSAPAPMPDYALLGSDVFTRFGWASCVLDFNKDGVDDLAVSAPMYGWDASWVNEVPYSPAYMYWGRVHVYFGAKGAGLAQAVPNVVIQTTVNTTFLGMHLRSGDVNADGFADLIIGSPMALVGVDQVSDVKDAAQRGRVDVFYASTSYGSVSSYVELDVIASANLTGNGTTPYEWFGRHSVVVANVSLPAEVFLQDVAPGALAACAAARELDARDIMQTSAQGSVLLVGSPGYRAAQLGGGYAAVGRIYGFAVPASGSLAEQLRACATSSNTVLPMPMFSFTGSESLSQLIDVEHVNSPKFGFAFDVATGNSFPVPLLAVGIPDTDGDNSSGIPGFNTAAGAVALLPLPLRTLHGDYNWTALATSARAILYSGMPEARFGMSVAFQDVNNDGVADLLVGAPMYTPNFLIAVPSAAGPVHARALQEIDLGHEKGALFVYAGGPGLVNGTISNAETAASARVEGAVQFGRLGAVAVGADMNGDGKRELVVGAPRATVVLPSGDAPETAGAVYVYSL